MSPIIVGDGQAAPDASTVDGAILARLGNVPYLNVYDGYVFDSDGSANTISAPLPYVVYYTTPGFPTNPRLGGSVGQRAREVQVSFVGSTREQAMWAAAKAEGALDQARVTVNGRSLLIRRTDDNPFVRRDDMWTRPDGGPLFFGALRFVVA